MMIVLHKVIDGLATIVEARVPYVAAELRNPLCVYAYMVNDDPDGPT